MIVVVSAVFFFKLRPTSTHILKSIRNTKKIESSYFRARFMKSESPNKVNGKRYAFPFFYVKRLLFNKYI